ncbi:MAG: hypothetical protein N3B18_02875, partial [Desulfobacterota bacterium]|nr:hypothetical protein [Thermodesulfobacteriota bacterium]
ISVRPGEHQTREFLVSERFSLARPGPIEAFLVYSWAITGTAGVLEITPPVVPGYQTGWVVFGMIVLGYSLDRGPFIKVLGTSSPSVLKAQVPIESTFGIYYVGMAVLGATSSRMFPIPFSITFSVTPGDAEARGDPIDAEHRLIGAGAYTSPRGT